MQHSKNLGLCPAIWLHVTRARGWPHQPHKPRNEDSHSSISNSWWLSFTSSYTKTPRGALLKQTALTRQSPGPQSQWASTAGNAGAQWKSSPPPAHCKTDCHTGCHSWCSVTRCSKGCAVVRFLKRKTGWICILPELRHVASLRVFQMYWHIKQFGCKFKNSVGPSSELKQHTKNSKKRHFPSAGQLWNGENLRPCMTTLYETGLENNPLWRKEIALFWKDFIYLFLESREREGEKHQCVVASCAPPTGGLARNPGMCPDWELNWQGFGSQAHAQSTELH